MSTNNSGGKCRVQGYIWDDRVDVVTAQVEATDALQEATEAYMHAYFTGRYLIGVECSME